MAHFAELDDDNRVIAVVVVANAAIDPNDEEQSGIAFLATLGDGRYVQTSYNNNMRKQYAGIGDQYDADADVFIRPQPFASWSLDSDYDWQPPTPMPTDGQMYAWVEDDLDWVEVVG